MIVKVFRKVLHKLRSENKSFIIQEHEKSIEYLCDQLDQLDSFCEEMMNDKIYYKQKCEEYEKRFGIIEDSSVFPMD